MSQAIILRSTRMGKGDNLLGEQLMQKFLEQLNSVSNKPEYIILYNSAVTLLREGTVASKFLDELFRSGVDIVACGTCIQHFDMVENLATGRISGMQEIVEIISNSSSVTTV